MQAKDRLPSQVRQVRGVRTPRPQPLPLAGRADPRSVASRALRASTLAWRTTAGGRYFLGCRTLALSLLAVLVFTLTGLGQVPGIGITPTSVGASPGEGNT